jgi:subtilisin family serine protease
MKFSSHPLLSRSHPNAIRILCVLLLLVLISAPQASGITSALPDETQPAYLPGRVIIKLRDTPASSIELGPASTTAGDQILDRGEVLSATGLYSEPAAYPELAREAGLDQVYVLELQEGVDVQQAIEELAADPSIEYAEPDYVLTTAVIPNDLSFGQQWGMNNTGQLIIYGSVGSSGKPDADIDLPEAWNITRGSRDTIIAIIDTGVDLTHPDLAFKLVPGYNFISPFSPPQDDGGHGTHVAGTAAAVTNNATGVAGVCWECRIMPLKALGVNAGSTTTVSAAIRYAVDHGAHVINLSLGGPAGNETLLSAVRYAYAANVPIVAAMMNEAKTYPDRVYYPAAYPETIAVGSTDKMDLRSDFSSYGNHIDLSAPGSEILSTYWVTPDQHNYAYLWGTSMATPHVAGVLGLMRSVAPQLGIEQLRIILRSSTDDLGDPGWDIFYGTGRLNAYRALTLTPKAITDLRISGPPILKIGESASFSARVGPNIADTPITYSWEVTGQFIRTATTSTLSNIVSYSWSTPGAKTIRVTASNASSSKTILTTVYVGESIHFPTLRNKK